MDYTILNPSDNIIINILKYGIIPIFLCLVVVVTITLLINHYVSLEIKKRKSSILDTTDKMLTELLFWRGTVEQMRVPVEVFKFSVPYTKNWCRNLVMYRILEMKQFFLLDTNTLFNIYKLFGFNKVTNELITHKKWHKRSLGIYHLQYIYDTSQKKQLDILLKEKNPQVKSNALITLITIAPERFGILYNYKEPLNKADEIKILDIIYHSTPTLPKNTYQLLKSENTSIVVLGIKLLVLYKAHFSIEQLKKIIRLSNFRIRKEAVKAVGKLKIYEAKDLLVDQYKIEQHKIIKINILISLKKIGDKELLKFLESILREENDEDIIFKTIDAIEIIDPLFFEKNENSAYLTNKGIHSMVLHVKDKLLV